MRITTMNPNQPEATALASRGGTFVAVGDRKDVDPFIGPFTTVIDALGKRLIPGLIDSHTHAIRGAVNYHLEVRWDSVDSLEQGLHLLRVQAERTPQGNLFGLLVVSLNFSSRKRGCQRLRNWTE